MKIYTKTGDSGETGLSGGSRVSKTDARILAIGSVDELNAALGICLLHVDGDERRELEQVQSELFDVGAELSCPADGRIQHIRLAESSIRRLELSIDRQTEALPPLAHFILPGGSPAAAHLHWARTVCRRAETAVVALHAEEGVRPLLIQYLNRLSDWLFVTARTANRRSNVEDVKWNEG